jgi:hypothetical protein
MGRRNESRFSDGFYLVAIKDMLRLNNYLIK